MDRKRAQEPLVREQSELTELYERISESSGLDVSVEEATGELTGVDQHLGDHATEMFEREKDQLIGQGLTRKLEEIDAAMGRIDRGEYGVCQVCGREISDERLEAVPATRFCREHADYRQPDSDPDVDHPGHQRELSRAAEGHPRERLERDDVSGAARTERPLVIYVRLSSAQEGPNEYATVT